MVRVPMAILSGLGMNLSNEYEFPSLEHYSGPVSGGIYIEYED